MKVFLAATSDKAFIPTIKDIPYVLESFYYIQDWQPKYIKNHWKMFLLDSGAFTFMNGCNNKQINWKKYIDDYCDFIIKHDIKYFFELDIDVVVGYEKVKEITKYIEMRTNKKPIPVWHKARGGKEWERLCKKYNYVAIGGIVTKEIKEQEYKFLPEMIRIAHKYECKVHGLGFTSMKYLTKVHFDSVDSTNWKSGGRFGQIHMFNGKRIVSKSYKDKRAKYKEIDAHNLSEWIKFQNYMEGR